MSDRQPGDQDPSSRHLFRRFPDLVGRLPWIPLVDLPTPVRKLEALGGKLGMTDLWVKRDDLTSPLYGGNKPRKLEFVLAEARAKGRREVLTLGGFGSNHCVATTIFCRRTGFDPILMLSPQPVLSYVRKNLLVNLHHKARMVYNESVVMSLATAARLCLGPRLRGRVPPYFMFFGGTSRAGITGFVEAGLELAAQVEAGDLPCPKRIFVATGSCGTHAGLIIGLKLAGLPTEVVGVRVVEKELTNRHVVAFHVNRTARYLKRLDPSVPAIRVRADEVRLLEDHFGEAYGRPTPEGKEAMALAAETEGLTLDPTYTGKTFAGLRHTIEAEGLAHEPILFWNTLNSADLSGYTDGMSPDNLPPALQRVFTDPLYDPEL